MSPATFWRMALLEWNDAVEGLAEKNGAGALEAFSRDELDELMEAYPDGQ